MYMILIKLTKSRYLCLSMTMGYQKVLEVGSSRCTIHYKILNITEIYHNPIFFYHKMLECVFTIKLFDKLKMLHNSRSIEMCHSRKLRPGFILFCPLKSISFINYYINTELVFTLIFDGRQLKDCEMIKGIKHFN